MEAWGRGLLHANVTHRRRREETLDVHLVVIFLPRRGREVVAKDEMEFLKMSKKFLKKHLISCMYLKRN